MNDACYYGSSGLPAPTIKDLEADSKIGPIFKMFYPRCYTPVGGYGSPKLPAAVLAMFTLAKVLPNPLLDMEDVTLQSAVLTGICLHQLGMPTYWLGKDMATALVQTEPPGTLKVTDLRLPMETMLVMLPEGTLTDFDGTDLPWLAWNYVDGIRKDTGETRKILTVITGAWPDPQYATYINELDDLASLSKVPTRLSNPLTGGPRELQGVEGALPLRLMHLAVNIIMLMSARPAMVETPTQPDMPAQPDGKTAARPGQKAGKMFSPNWIGRWIAGCHRVSLTPTGRTSKTRTGPCHERPPTQDGAGQDPQGRRPREPR